MANWRQVLCCVQCGAALDSEFHCSVCGQTYGRAATGAPILMTAADRERFEVLLQQDGGSRMKDEYSRRLQRDWIRNFYPPDPVYVDTAAPPLPNARPGMHLWIGGAGLQLPGFVNVDVAPVFGVDVIANAARLPFQRASCDSVACLALLEHVKDPDRVVAEIHRVLKSGSEVQVVVPFCHPYHAYPADYSRFSRERLEHMFSEFRQVDIGIHTGPTTTMLTFMTYYLKLIFPVHGGRSVRRALNRVLVGGAGWLMNPLKYLDRWINRLPNAHVLANHLYVIASK